MMTDTNDSTSSGPGRAHKGPLRLALQKTLRSVGQTPEDAAAARLAGDYADAIDAAEDRQKALGDLGPKLLTVLTALNATPAARASLGVTGDGEESALTKFRARNGM